MNIFIGIVLLIIGFLLSNWASKYSGRNAIFTPLIFRNPIFSIFLLIITFGSLLLGVYFVFRGSIILGLLLVIFWLYGFIKDRRINSDKAVARWVFNAYREYKRVYPKEKEQKIFERIFKKQLKDKESLPERFIEEQVSKIKDVRDLVSQVIFWKNPQDEDFSNFNFEKWMKHSDKKRKTIQEVYEEVFEGREKGKRYVPIITGVVELLVGAWLITLGSIMSWFGFFLILIGLHSLKVGTWGSQKLIDELTLKKYENMSEETKEEMKKHKPW